MTTYLDGLVDQTRTISTPYRVWHSRNSTMYYYEADTPEEGSDLINHLIQQDLSDPAVVMNAFGLEERDGTDWCEWYNEHGEDIHEAFGDDDA